MEGFEHPYNESDRAKLTDADGKTLIVSGQIVRRIAREAAPYLSLEELAIILRKAADLEWAQGGTNVKRKILASEVHELAAKLQGLSLRLYE